MNTNSKHYETLNIQPWEIMEANFTTEEFIAYLKGNIIKYALRSKGQDLSDAEKIKHYAEKLIEVLEQEDKHKFKVGDRVEVLSWRKHLKGNHNATIIRINDKTQPDKEGYLLELDKKDAGWKATENRHGVNCDNTWWVVEKDIKLLEAEPKKTLEPNKWYDAEDITVEELEELLPVGTTVTVTGKHDNDREVNFDTERLLSTTVQNIGKRWLDDDVRVGITADHWWRRHFKIVKEN